MENPNKSGRYNIVGQKNSHWVFLEPGEYNVTFSVKDDSDQSSESTTKNFSVLEPVENAVTLTLWRNEFWYQEGESVSITGQVSHTYLESCSLEFIYGEILLSEQDSITFVKVLTYV